jgi:hypothetical protein
VLNILLRQIKLSDLLSAALRQFGTKDIVDSLIRLFGITDIFGYAVTYAMDVYRQHGREAVVRLAVIRETSLRTWAGATGADPDRVVDAGRKFGEAFADFVEAFFPARMHR